MTIIIGGILGFIYLILINKLVEKSMDFLEKKGVKDHCLKVLPALSFVFFSSLLISFFLPKSINKFTGVFSIFTYFSGIGLNFILFLFIIVRPLSPTFYKKLFK